MTRPVATTMTPAPEKAAPIPAEDAVDTVAGILASHDGRKYVLGPDFDLAYKIVRGLADRATRPPAGPSVEEETEPYRIVGRTYDGVNVLAPKVPSQNFTEEEARSAVKKALANSDRESEIRRLGCMCQNVEIGSHAVSVGLSLPPHMQDYSANRAEAGLSPDIAVDACLVGEIRALWSKGIRTYGSCCGHNKVRGMINVHQNDAEAMRAMGYEQWPISEGKWEWTFYPKSIRVDVAALEAEASEGERRGWVLVPREPTKAMLYAKPGTSSTHHETYMRALWVAMLNAALILEDPVREAE